MHTPSLSHKNLTSRINISIKLQISFYCKRFYLLNDEIKMFVLFYVQCRTLFRVFSCNGTATVTARKEPTIYQFQAVVTNVSFV